MNITHNVMCRLVELDDVGLLDEKRDGRVAESGDLLQGEELAGFYLCDVFGDGHDY